MGHSLRNSHRGKLASHERVGLDFGHRLGDDQVVNLLAIDKEVGVLIYQRVGAIFIKVNVAPSSQVLDEDLLHSMAI